jgi:hypothetical protein
MAVQGGVKAGGVSFAELGSGSHVVRLIDLDGSKLFLVSCFNSRVRAVAAEQLLLTYGFLRRVLVWS